MCTGSFIADMGSSIRQREKTRNEFLFPICQSVIHFLLERKRRHMHKIQAEPDSPIIYLLLSPSLRLTKTYSSLACITKLCAPSSELKYEFWAKAIPSQAWPPPGNKKIKHCTFTWRTKANCAQIKCHLDWLVWESDCKLYVNVDEEKCVWRPC